MKDEAKLAIAIGCLLLAGLWFNRDKLPWPNPAPDPNPQPIPAGGPDMLAVFRAGDPARAKVDAGRTAAFFGSLARSLDFDARLSPPKLKNDVDVHDARKNALAYWSENDGLASRYGSFATIAGGYLEQTLGDKAQELTATRRSQWCAAFNALSQACLRAEGAL